MTPFRHFFRTSLFLGGKTGSLGRERVRLCNVRVRSAADGRAPDGDVTGRRISRLLQRLLRPRSASLNREPAAARRPSRRSRSGRRSLLRSSRHALLRCRNRPASQGRNRSWPCVSRWRPTYSRMDTGPYATRQISLAIRAFCRVMMWDRKKRVLGLTCPLCLSLSPTPLP